MKKVLLGIITMIVMLVSLTGSVLASCQVWAQGGGNCAPSCPRPPTIYAIASNGEMQAGLVCLGGKYTCFEEYCPIEGTCSCVWSKPAWSAYTSGADGGMDVCNGVSSWEKGPAEIVWGGDCYMFTGGSYVSLSCDDCWDANERELVIGCYYMNTTSATDIGSQTFKDGYSVPELSKVSIMGEVSSIGILQAPIETESRVPLHWKSATLNGTYMLYYGLGTPAPENKICFLEEYPIPQDPDIKVPFWNCLEPRFWDTAVCESATCGADIKCDNQSPGFYLYPYTCTAYGTSYFADGCSLNCSLTEDKTICWSSALASGCTASTDCNSIAPNTNITKCSNENTYFADKCSSTCSAVDRGDNICRSSAFASGCSAISACNGLNPGSNINTCNNGGQTYFADKCSSSCGGQDRGDNICRSSSFASGCTAVAECNGKSPESVCNSDYCSSGRLFDYNGDRTLNSVTCTGSCGCDTSIDNSQCDDDFCGAAARCDEKYPGSDGSNDWECSDSSGIPSTSANQQCWCSGTCGIVNDGCESNYGASATCDEKSPGEDLPSCGLAGKTYFADECGTGDCLLKDRDNICRSSAFASDCTADSQCNGVVAGTNNCNANCRYCTCTNWTPIIDQCCYSPTGALRQYYTRTCNPAGCNIQEKCDGYCMMSS
jgi:hypothetical protein